MTEFSPSSTVGSLPADRSVGGDASFDVEQIFQALLLNQTLVDDDESSEGSSSGFPTARGSPADTLRELRRSGALGEMSGEAFTRLLAGTLYEYDNTAPPTPLANPASRLDLHGVDSMSMNGGLRGVDRGDLDATLAFLETAIADEDRRSTPLTRSVSGSGGFTSAPVSERSRADLDTEPFIVSFAESTQSSPSSTAGPGWTARSSDPGALPSPWSTARSEARSDGFWRTARTVLGDSAMSALGFQEGSEPEGVITAHVRGMLRQLAGDGEFDETWADSARRMVQLGSVVNGQRLSDEEIMALPKAKFEQKDAQTCPICLDVYQQSEILTQLRCSHFFHTSCVTRWFQRSTQCPLCRTNQGNDAE